MRLSSGLCQKVYCSSRLSGNVPLSSRRGTKVCLGLGLGLGSGSGLGLGYYLN